MTALHDLSTAPEPVRFEHRDGLGVGTATPRLSWRLPARAHNQVAYEVGAERDGVSTSTGRVDSAEQVLVAWPFTPLRSRESAAVRVRVWTTSAVSAEPEPSPWSQVASVEAGLLAPEDWTAVPVGVDDPASRDRDLPPVRIRHEFEVPRGVRSARLYVSAHGLAQVEINGRRVGRDELAPDWTVYGARLGYRTHDVTEFVTAGRNAVGAWLADGWYRGRVGFNGGTRAIYGTDQALLAQLEIRHDDGSTTTVATGPGWEVGPSPVTAASLYDGETFDARRYDPRWSTVGGGDAAWRPATRGVVDHATLFAPTGPPVRCTEQRRPISITDRGDGTHLVDFGQNLVGRVRIRVEGPEGHVVSLRHAEVLDAGALGTRPLRLARAQDTYVLRGEGPETWAPRFTIHGFRHVEVRGWPGRLTSDDLVAEVLHTDLERTGWFTCSDPLVTRLHENVVWSARGNFVGIPTDCPARDERLGWTGDLQVFAPTAAFLFDCTGMLDSWLTDVAVEQLPDGTVPWYVPVVPGAPQWTPINPGAAWGDVSTLTPVAVHDRTGDLDLLRRHVGTGRRWVELIERLAGPSRLWDTGMQLGDWLDPFAPPEDPSAGATDRYLVATAYFAWSARNLGIAYERLGEPAESARFHTLADEVRVALRQRWCTTGGRLVDETVTGYALLVCFDLLDDPELADIGERLAAQVELAAAHITTGFVGTPLVCDALTRTGQLATAYRLLLQTECPSWLYTVSMGATTIWERWDSLLPDGTLNPGEMTSFNHYALGAVADWLHRVVAGLGPDAPGWRRARIAPRPGGGITSAAAEHRSPYGLVAVSWEVVDDVVRVEAVVPPGTRAVLDLEGAKPEDVGPGTHRRELPTVARAQTTPVLR